MKVKLRAKSHNVEKTVGVLNAMEIQISDTAAWTQTGVARLKQTTERQEAQRS
jgi:hypothetical protein